jgi:type IV pilus assembly protein PilO
VAKLAIDKLPWYGQLAAFVALAAAMVGAFYYFVETGLQVTLAAKNTELTQIRDRVAKGVESARRLPEFRNQVGDLENRLESLKPILPDEKDAGDLLRRIQTLAVQSNLVIKGYRPQVTTAQEMYDEWPITLTIDGNYHNLGLFLDRVSKFPRIINIGNLVIEQKNPPTEGATMAITATATTFVLVDRPAPVEPESRRGKKAPAEAPAKKSS